MNYSFVDSIITMIK